MNAILTVKKQQCEAAGVPFVTEVENVRYGAIRDTDLVSLLQNLLDICMGTMMEARRPLWIAVVLGLAKSVRAQFLTQMVVAASPEKYANLPLINAIFGSFILVSTITYFPSIRDAKGMMLGCYTYILFWVLVFTMIVFLVIAKYRREIFLEQNYLKMQLEQMMAHYTAMKLTRIEEARCALDAQMRELLGQEDDAARSERIHAYIRQLRQEYDTVRAGVYCDDLMVDSVLYCQAQRLKKQGVELECSCQGYALGQIKEKDIAELLTQLLAAASVRQTKQKISLQMATVKDRLLIVLDWADVQNGRSVKRKLFGMRKLLKKYDSIVHVEAHDGAAELQIGLAQNGTYDSR